MRRIILSLHTTLDGFVAGPNGEMDFFMLDDEMFDLVGKFTIFGSPSAAHALMEYVA